MTSIHIIYLIINIEIITRFLKYNVFFNSIMIVMILLYLYNEFILLLFFTVIFFLYSTLFLKILSNI